MRIQLITEALLLWSVSTAISADADGTDTDAEDSITTFAPRDHVISSSILLEQADVHRPPVISDANFKTLVRHCLKSHDPSACDTMAAWDVSRVTDCALLFWEPTNDANEDWVLLDGADTFNVDISKWNTSSCTTMKSMFNGAASFDQPIGDWNVHRVTDMSHMFQGARQFNRDISKFKTDNVLTMSHMFRYASRFHNPDLSYWDTSRVTDFSYMFASASHFSGKLNWNVGRVQHFQNMFHNADLFNSFIGDWDVGGAIDDPEDSSYGFVSMFEGARDFNRDISHWSMNHARKLDFMFRDAYTFDQDLSHWAIDEVESMTDMFGKAKSFSQTLCWDLSGKVTGKLFEGTKGASAESDVEHCWEMKHYENGHDTQFGTISSNGSIENNPSSNNGDYQATAMYIRFLQAFLMAAVVALATYWLVLVRRFLKEKNTKYQLEDKVARRASRMAVEGSSRSTYDDDDEEGEEDISSEASDDDSVEILFETQQEVDYLRQRCFGQQIFAEPSLRSYGEPPVEHAVPMMSMLLQQEAERQRNYTPGLSVRSSRGISSRRASEVQLTSNIEEDMGIPGIPQHQTTIDTLIEVPSFLWESSPAPAPQPVHTVPALPLMSSSHENSQMATVAQPKKKGGIKFPFKVRLSKKGRRKSSSGIDAPSYVITGVDNSKSYLVPNPVDGTVLV